MQDVEAKELREWVQSLSLGEKRFIKQLGNARSRGKASQMLALMDWLAQSEADSTLPADAGFTRNYSMLSDRLKGLILDGLQLLHSHDDLDSQLRTLLNQVALLMQKDLLAAVKRILKRAKKLATASARYLFLLQCLDWERHLLQLETSGDISGALSLLRAEEEKALEGLSDLRKLVHLHDTMRAKSRQLFIPRDNETLKEVQQMAMDPVVARCLRSDNYIARALVVNILGIKNIFERNHPRAISRYRRLLEEWNSNPDWQRDKPWLLYHICNYYQNACLTSNLGSEEMNAHLGIIPDFRAISTKLALQFQRALYMNQLLATMNQGHLDQAIALIPSIDRWLIEHQDKLLQSSVVSFLYNFMVTEFVCENYAAANRFANRLLNVPNRKLREDLREFTLVLQSILYFELQDHQLIEYLLRAAKRRFRGKRNRIPFEPTVLRFLEKSSQRLNADAQNVAVAQLVEDLATLSKQAKNGVQPIGLMEVRLWAESKQTQKPLKEVFQAVVQANLDALG